ncbi:MAG: glycosyltransferase [Veillonella atypica]
MKYNSIPGVPNFVSEEFVQKKSNYCICIPIINEGQRIHDELKRARKYKIDAIADIIICDGGSIDGSTDNTLLEALGVNTLLIKKGPGKQGAQLRMGIWWALERGYKGIITIDGNNKDSIEDVPKFIEKLEAGYDFIQGSRFIKGGKAINTPFPSIFIGTFASCPGYFTNSPPSFYRYYQCVSRTFKKLFNQSQGTTTTGYFQYI